MPVLSVINTVLDAVLLLSKTNPQEQNVTELCYVQCSFCFFALFF